MFGYSEPDRGLFRRRPPVVRDPIKEARARERAESLAILRDRQKTERLQQQIERMVKLWPVAVGFLLGAVAPELANLAKLLGPWGMPLVFPFAVLAARPEIQGGPVTHLLPAIMLYWQFPIEGLLARFILERRTTKPLGIVIQVAIFHFLGIVELWLLTGAGQRLLEW